MHTHPPTHTHTHTQCSRCCLPRPQDTRERDWWICTSRAQIAGSDECTEVWYDGEMHMACSV